MQPNRYVAIRGPTDALAAGGPVIRALSLSLEFKALQSSEGSPAPDRCVVAIGHPALRQRWQQVLEASGAPLGVVVHPRACVSPSAQLAPGCVVLAGAVVDHDALCVSYSQLGVNAAMAGGSRLGPLVALAAGEVLGCGDSRFAELDLTPGAADLS